MGTRRVSGNAQIRLCGEHRSVSSGILQRDGVSKGCAFAFGVSRRRANHWLISFSAHFSPQQCREFRYELRRPGAMEWKAGMASAFPTAARQTEYDSGIPVWGEWSFLFGSVARAGLDRS